MTTFKEAYDEARNQRDGDEILRLKKRARDIFNAGSVSEGPEQPDTAAVRQAIKDFGEVAIPNGFASSETRGAAAERMSELQMIWCDDRKIEPGDREA